MVSLGFFSLKNKIDSFSRSWRSLSIIISQIQKINNAYFLLHVYSKQRNPHGSIRKHFGKKRGTVGRRKGEKITLIKYIIYTCVDVMMKHIIQYNSSYIPYNETQMWSLTLIHRILHLIKRDHRVSRPLSLVVIIILHILSNISHFSFLLSYFYLKT